EALAPPMPDAALESMPDESGDLGFFADWEWDAGGAARVKNSSRAVPRRVFCIGRPPRVPRPGFGSPRRYSTRFLGRSGMKAETSPSGMRHNVPRRIRLTTGMTMPVDPQ